MTDVSWNIETADWGTLTATSVLADSHPTFTVGSELELTFYFGPDISNHESYYSKLKEYSVRTKAETVDTGTDIRGVPWYRERLHPNATYSSGLVKLVPSSNINGASSYWCVIIGATDETKYVGAGEKLTLKLFVLAQGDEYPTRSDVELDMKAEL